MDTAVALVQTYLHVNGYFTVTEYPLVEALKRGQVRSRTDLDIIAFRFAPGEETRARLRGDTARHVDPLLKAPLDAPDMIIGEVKEGATRFNEAMRDEHVLRAALARFGCCPPAAADPVVHSLLTDGAARTPAGHHVRLVAFGISGRKNALRRGEHVVELSHVIRFLQRHVAEHRSILRASATKDAALAVLILLDKAGIRPQP